MKICREIPQKIQIGLQEWEHYDLSSQSSWEVQSQAGQSVSWDA